MAPWTAPSRQDRTLGPVPAPSQAASQEAPETLLSDLAAGQSATISSLAVEPGLRHRPSCPPGLPSWRA